MTNPSLLCAVACLAVACAPPLVIEADPSHASQFGQVAVTFKGSFGHLGAIKSVTVGGLQTYGVTADGGSITATIQGSPSAGAADIVVTGASGSLSAKDAFTYDAPVAHAGQKWMAFGASLTQGFESEGLFARTQLHSASADIARQAGAYLGFPLFNPNLIPGLTLADFNMSCQETTSVEEAYLNAVTEPDGMTDLALARVDPTLTPRNIAVGGSKVAVIANGNDPAGQALIENVVENPKVDANDIFNGPTMSQVDRLVAEDPDVAFCTDLLANDVDGSVTQTDDIYPDMVTPPATVAPLLNAMMARLGALHGQYFIANLPSLTFIPGVQALRTSRIAAGLDTETTFDAKVQQIDDLTTQLDAALVASMMPYPNLHLVDFQGEVQGDLTAGVVVGGQTLTVALFGGLLSLDGLHFTDTGYALLANVFITSMNSVLSSKIPAVDAVSVLAQDPLSPAVLRADGYTCVPPA